VLTKEWSGVTDEHDHKGAFEVGASGQIPVGPGVPTSFDPRILDFGHYAGQTIAELATVDPDYLRWLERHPSGTGYRAEIHRVLGEVPASIRWDR
jgi:hypothetical protein